MADSAAINKAEGLNSSASSDNTQSDSGDKADSAKSNIKFEWYQTNTHVTISLLVKNVKPDQLKIDFHQQSLSATIETDKDIYNKLDINLAHEIVTTQCTSRVLTSKVEIKLSKRYAEHWSTLERAEISEPIKPISSSRKWDEVVETELKDDKTESDAALNDLFQKIYSQGSDEVKKAMNKSFLESGGTVLSTNWKEVARDTVKIKPPDGMEWKKWDT